MNQLTFKLNLARHGQQINQLAGAISYMSCIMTKLIKRPGHPAKTQISLGIRPVCSESSLCVQCVAKDQRCLLVDSKDSNLTGRMPRLI